MNKESENKLREYAKKICINLTGVENENTESYLMDYMIMAFTDGEIKGLDESICKIRNMRITRKQA